MFFGEVAAETYHCRVRASYKSRFIWVNLFKFQWVEFKLGVFTSLSPSFYMLGNSLKKWA